MVLPTLAFNFKIHFEAQDSSRSLEIVISRKCLIETRTFLLPTCLSESDFCADAARVAHLLGLSVFTFAKFESLNRSIA